MERIKKYLAILFLALIITPVIEKTGHELKHLKEKHCTGHGLHFCADEITCDVCDYVFSNANTPPTNKPEWHLPAPTQQKLCITVTNKLHSKSILYFSLRAPPAQC